jgi:hypothetical protein
MLDADAGCSVWLEHRHRVRMPMLDSSKLGTYFCGDASLGWRLMLFDHFLHCTLEFALLIFV